MFLLLAARGFASDFPLESITIDADVSGPLADVVVTQTFRNTHSTFIEATYLFPLPEDAAIDALTMYVADREIVGEIQEKQAAIETYEQAVAEGRSAALTEQLRPNVFSQRVGNIPPGETITVTLHLIQPVEYQDGVWSLAFPLVVAPRFVPAGEPWDVATPTVQAQTGLRADISVVIEAGQPVLDMVSPTHEPSILVDETGAAVSLEDVPTTRDFVLQWSLDTTEPQVVAYRAGEHLLLAMEPPVVAPREDVVPRELIFLVDTSCSMNGVPLGMAKDAMTRAFDAMDERDSFLVLDFNDAVSTLAPTPIPATPANIEAGRAYVEAFRGHGGSMMLTGIEAALNLPPDPKRERYVCLLTDGFIGNELQIISAIEDSIGDARLYAFGLGYSVNRYLLDEVGRVGRGRVTYVIPDEDPELAVNGFLDSIAQPVLADIDVDWGGSVDAAPAYLPDLVAGQPLWAVARADGVVGDTVQVSGRLGDQVYLQEIPIVDLPEDVHALASVWGRARIAELERQQHWGEIADVRSAILDVALEYGLLSEYTSFVAVDRRIVNTTGELRGVSQPLDVPDGVIYNTDVSREYTPPGDPLLTVVAPADARSVLAAFPWGEVVELRWDTLRDHWYHRFLVPRDMPEGEMMVAIFITDAAGQLSRQFQWMVVDGQAPELDVLVEVEDGYTRVTVYPEEPLRSIQVQPVGHPELRQRKEISTDGHAFIMEIPGMWAEVEIVAKDRAMNTITQRVEQ